MGEGDAGIGLIRAILQTVILSFIWVVGLAVVFVPLMFLIGLLSAFNAILAQLAFFIILFFSVLAGCALVFYAARNFRPQAECFSLDLKQFADVALHAPDQQYVCIECFFALARVELFVAGSGQ